MIHTCVIAATRYELLRSLKRTIEPDVEVVAMVDNQVSLRDSMLALEPDLIVLDLEFLGRIPAKIVSILRSRSPEVGMIVLVEGDDPRAEDEAKKAGVDRLLLRTRAGSELVTAALEVVGERMAVRETNRGTLLS